MLLVLSSLFVLLGATLVYGAISKQPLRLWTSGHAYYQIVPRENPHPLATAAGIVIAALLVGAVSLRMWRAQR